MGEITRDIYGLSFKEVCEAIMTKDKEAYVDLIINVKKGRVKRKKLKAQEWVCLGSSNNVCCEKLICHQDGSFTITATGK